MPRDYNSNRSNAAIQQTDMVPLVGSIGAITNEVRLHGDSENPAPPKLVTTNFSPTQGEFSYVDTSIPRQIVDYPHPNLSNDNIVEIGIPVSSGEANDSANAMKVDGLERNSDGSIGLMGSTQNKKKRWKRIAREAHGLYVNPCMSGHSGKRQIELTAENNGAKIIRIDEVLDAPPMNMQQHGQPRLFQFDTCWINEKECEDIVAEAWSRVGESLVDIMTVVLDGIEYCSSKLRQWYTTHNITTIRHEIRNKKSKLQRLNLV
ncbi:hypothetical protein ACOSP7_014063 [Xanthoceras sorbifolium]